MYIYIYIYMYRYMYTVEPHYNGHLGAELSGCCREVAVVGRYV